MKLIDFQFYGTPDYILLDAFLFWMMSDVWKGEMSDCRLLRADKNEF